MKAARLHVLVPCCCGVAFVGCSSALVPILCLKEGSLRSDLLILECGVSSTVTTGCVIKDVDGLMLCETEASHTKLRPDKILLSSMVTIHGGGTRFQAVEDPKSDARMFAWFLNRMCSHNVRRRRPAPSLERVRGGRLQ